MVNDWRHSHILRLYDSYSMGEKQVTPTLNTCQKAHLGEYATEKLERLNRLMVKTNIERRQHVSCSGVMSNPQLWFDSIQKSHDILQEIIEVKHDHVLPTDGSCYKCDFNKPCYMEI